MSNDAVEWHEAVGEMLLHELRGAVAARLQDGADPEAVTIDLTDRIKRVRALRPGSAQ